MGISSLYRRHPGGIWFFGPRHPGGISSLYRRPHPSIDSKTIISLDGAVFSMDPGENGVLLKKGNGDALYSKVNPPMASEARWGADDGSPNSAGISSRQTN